MVTYCPETWWGVLEEQATDRSGEHARHLRQILRSRTRRDSRPGRRSSIADGLQHALSIAGGKRVPSRRRPVLRQLRSQAIGLLSLTLSICSNFVAVNSYHAPSCTGSLASSPGWVQNALPFSSLRRQVGLQDQDLAPRRVAAKHSGCKLSRLNCLHNRKTTEDDAVQQQLRGFGHPPSPAALGSLLWPHHRTRPNGRAIRLALRDRDRDDDDPEPCGRYRPVDVDEVVDEEFLCYDEELEDSSELDDEGEGGAQKHKVDEVAIDVDDALDEEFLGPARVAGGDVSDDWLVYTWDGDLIMSQAFYSASSSRDASALSTELLDFLGDGEYTVYTEDGDEQPVQVSWDVFDRWDTYDSTIVDPQSAEFANRVNFRIPPDYDWNASTADNYRAGAEEASRFYGKFEDVRAQLDYSYHVNYQRDRQRLQDQIVKYWISHGKRARRPWILFTAGAMGAGKSHCIKRLEARGVATLSEMVKVDPDTVKYQLPEMQEYISRNPGPNPSPAVILAGQATHNESAFLQEMIVSELLERSKHLIVDGSLSNADWFASYFAYIRARYPQYRIGIIHVVCDPEVIWGRVVDRCRRTGRCISRPVVDLSVKMTPLAVDRLSPLTDITVVVDSGKGDEEDEKVQITRLSEETAEAAARHWMKAAMKDWIHTPQEEPWTDKQGDDLLEMLKGQKAVELLDIVLGQ